MASDYSTGTSDSAIREMLDAYNYSEAEWQPHRTERYENMRMLSGDHWPQEERAERDKNGRLCIDFDELNQHVNQVIGLQQMNEVGIQVLPEGDGSNDDTAELEANTIRAIEYNSKAGMARIWGLTSAAQGGYGFTVIRREYEKGSFRQEIRLKAVQNPDLITIDGRSKDLDGADMMCGWIKNRITRKEFHRQYGKDARVTNFDALTAQNPVYAQWISPTDVQVAEYWVKRMHRAKLLLIQPFAIDPATGLMVPTELEERYQEHLTKEGVKIDGKGVYVPKPDGSGMVLAGEIKDDRWDELPEVTQYHTNGVEILGDGVKWDGQWIPIIPYYCKVLYVNRNGADKRVLQGLVNLARGPQRAFSYCKTSTLEAIGDSTKAPYVAYNGQLDGRPEWNTANKKNHPFLLANAYTEEYTQGAPLPLPQRPSYQAEITAFEVAAESYRRSIQAAFGSSPLPTSAQRQNEKSGVALERIQDAAAVGTFGVIANYHSSIEMEGRQIEDLLASTITTPRTLRTRKPDGSYEMKKVEPRQFSYKHSTTINVAPAMQSQRQAVESLGDTIAKAWPAALDRIGWLLIKMRNLGPLADQMADLLKPADLKAADGEEDPAAQAQKMAQMQQAIQERDLMIQELDKKIVQFEAGIQAKQIEGDFKVQLEAMKNEADMRKAELIETNKRYIALLGSKTTLTLPAVQHKFKEQEIEQQGEIDEELADQEHEQSVEDADLSHEHATEQMETAAELAPEPKGEE